MLSGSTLLRHLAQFYCAIYSQAFLFYTLRRLGFSGAAKEEPVVQQIVLMNKDELEPLLRKQGFTREVS